MAPTGPATINGVEYVDLNLPSGNLWAKCNLGAQTETEIGYYWFAGSGTKYGPNTTYSGRTKSVSEYLVETPQGSRITPPRLNTNAANYCKCPYDPALQTMANGWVSPPPSAFKELVQNTNWQVDITIDGVKGCKFTSKVDSDKYIFIPYNGYYTYNSSNYTFSDKTSSKNYAMVLTSGGGYGSNSCCIFLSYNIYGENSGIQDQASLLNAYPIRPVFLGYQMQNGLDILFYDQNTGTKRVYNITRLPEPNTGLIPIAIEVVPRSINKYGDGRGAFVSLFSVDADGNGSLYEEYGRPVARGYKTQLAWSTSIPTTESLTYYMNNASYQYALGQQCIYDKKGLHELNNTTDNYYPYMYQDGVWSIRTEPFDEGYVRNDVDGVENTRKIGSSSSYPAARACLLYSTDGTNPGDWYLPSATEAAWFSANRATINFLLTVLWSRYGNVADPGFNSDYYSRFWTSSVGNEYYAYYLRPYDTSYGGAYIELETKTSTRTVRAFIRYKEGD